MSPKRLLLRIIEIQRKEILELADVTEGSFLKMGGYSFPRSTNINEAQCFPRLGGTETGLPYSAQGSGNATSLETSGGDAAVPARIPPALVPEHSRSVLL